MESRRLLCLFLVMFSVAASLVVGGDDGTVPDIASVSATKACLDNSRVPELKRLGGRKLALPVENNAEHFRASRSTKTVAKELCGGGRRRRRMDRKRRLRRRISHEEWSNDEFVAFNADYKAPRHHPPKNN